MFSSLILNALNLTLNNEKLTILLQRLARDVEVRGAKGVFDESPPPAQVIFPVVETPEVVQVTVTHAKRQES